MMNSPTLNGQGNDQMIGDVWVEKNLKGESVLCIGIGNGRVSKKVIKSPKDFKKHWIKSRKESKKVISKNETKVQTKTHKKG